MNCMSKYVRSAANAMVIAVVSSLLAACGKAAEAPVADEPTVSGETIHFSANAPAARRLVTARVVAAHEGVLTLPARLAWNEDHTSRVMAPVAGRITEILVQTGASVNANQILAYLASAELGTAQAEAARAQTDLAQAERNLSRAKDLAEAGIIARKDLEQAQNDLARAHAEAARTKLRLKSLGAASTVDQRFSLRSPIAGVVVERNTNPGMEWRPDQPAAPLFVVSDPTYLWAWVDAPERALGLLHPGQHVIIRASAWPQEKFEAQIEYVADGLDPVSRTLKVRARLRNSDRHLKSEMYVTAELARPATGTLDVPAKAVFLNGVAQQLFIKAGAGEFTRTTIAPVAVGDQWVSIADGLKKGDEVVVDGALYLQQLLEAAKQPGAGATAQATSQAAAPSGKPPTK